MKKLATGLVIGLFILGMVIPSSRLLAAPLKKVRASFSALAYANPPFWIAKDLELFKKYGLDVDLTYVEGGKGIHAMLGGSIDVAQIGGIATVSAAVEGADIVMLGTFFNRLAFSVHAPEQIKDIQDLKGKTLGTGAISGNSYFAALMLLSKFNWVLNKDVTLLAMGTDPAIFAALQQGRVHAAVLSAPTTRVAAKAGFREIFDIGSLNLPFPTISVVSSRKFVRENPETILNVLRAASEATYLYRTRLDLATPVISKYMQISPTDPSLAESHGLYAKYMNETLSVPLDGITMILNYLAEHLNRPELKASACFNVDVVVSHGYVRHDLQFRTLRKNRFVDLVGEQGNGPFLLLEPFYKEGGWQWSVARIVVNLEMFLDQGDGLIEDFLRDQNLRSHRIVPPKIKGARIEAPRPEGRGFPAR